MDVIEALVDGLIIGENSEDIGKKCMKTLAFAFKNILQNEKEEKYRKLTLTKVFTERILNVSGGREVLETVGFVETENGFRLPNDADLSRLEDAHAVLLARLGTSENAEEKRETASVAIPTATKSKADLEYEERQKETAIRLAALKKKQEEERIKAEILKKKMKAEQDEIRDRRISTASGISTSASSGTTTTATRFGAKSKTWSDIGVDLSNCGGGG